jgi:hypothetical protein
LAWNAGEGLVVAGTKLLSIWASDCPPPTGACATESGPHVGVFVQRAPISAIHSAWAKPMRLSPRSVHAERASIAASGSTVVAGWVTQTGYRTYSPRKPRVFWIRVSTNNGRTWRAAKRLSASRGRVDYPHLAIAGGRMYAVWTAAGGGAIRFAWSDDLGRSWTKTTIAATTSVPGRAAEGFAGFPDVGASGTNVAVAWVATDHGIQLVLTSANGGDDFASATPSVLTGRSPNDGQHYPAVGGGADPSDDRVAVAYTTKSSVEMRVFDGVTWNPAAPALAWPLSVGASTYDGGYGPAVLPLDSVRIAVAVAACRRNPLATNPCEPFAPGARIDVLYRVSPDGGATWNPVTRLSHATTPPYRTNDEPSIAITGTTQRVAFDRYQPTFKHYDVAMRSSV